MHECLLCKRDMKVSDDIFGKGCVKNIYSFLDWRMPKKVNLREKTLYKNIMKINNIRFINEKQKVWLADRYLTYQYLDKLPYGNYNILKTQINADIQNIHRIKKSNELKSEKQITLKQAYDLYKKTIKFQEGIHNLREGNFIDEESIKILISSFSFIFNMSKNKSQYETDSFKAMQYAFWQTVIEVGGKYANFDISADFLQHSLEKQPKDLIITEGKVVKDIISDQQFTENINSIVKQYGSNCDEFLFDSETDQNFPMNFDESDLYFSIHSASLQVIGKKQNEKWNLIIKLHDRYDYSAFKKANDYYNDTNSVPKSIFSSTLYNLAYYSMKFNVMKEYDIDIQFELNDFEVIK